MPEATIDYLLQHRGWPLLSFEFFPPKRPEGLVLLLRAAEQMRAAGPDFVSVTYGAGGSTRTATLDLCLRLRDMGLGLVMPLPTSRMIPVFSGRGARYPVSIRCPI